MDSAISPVIINFFRAFWKSLEHFEKEENTQKSEVWFHYVDDS